MEKPAVADLEACFLQNNNGSKLELKSIGYLPYSMRFWQLLAIMVLGTYYGTFFMHAYKLFGQNTSAHPQISDKTLTWAASIGAGLVNGLSRIGFGTLVDRYSFKALMSILMTIQLVNACVCFWAAFVPALYFVCILADFMVIAGLYTVFPVCVTNIFGLELGPQVYVQILLGGPITAFLCLFATKWLLPATNFVTLFYVGALTQVAVLLLLWSFKEELDVENLAKHKALKPRIQTKAKFVS